MHFLVRNELPKEVCEIALSSLWVASPPSMQAGKREQFWDLLKRFYNAKPDIFDRPNDNGERPLHLGASPASRVTIYCAPVCPTALANCVTHSGTTRPNDDS